MTFIEIFENFKNHSYIRRGCWDKNLFVQLRHTSPLIRMVLISDKAINTIDNDIRLAAEDLLANDWVDIDNC